MAQMRQEADERGRDEARDHNARNDEHEADAADDPADHREAAVDLSEVVRGRHLPHQALMTS